MQIRLIESMRALPARDLRNLATLLKQVVTMMGVSGEPSGFLFDDSEA